MYVSLRRVHAMLFLSGALIRLWRVMASNILRRSNNNNQLTGLTLGY